MQRLSNAFVWYAILLSLHDDLVIICSTSLTAIYICAAVAALHSSVPNREIGQCFDPPSLSFYSILSQMPHCAGYRYVGELREFRLQKSDDDSLRHLGC